MIRNRKQWFACMLATLCCIFFFFGCTPTSSVESSDDMCKVTLVESVFFQTDFETVDVKKGESVTVILCYLNGYTFSSCNYGAFNAVELENGDVALTLNQVKRSLRVSVESKKIEKIQVLQERTFTLHYEFGGGKLVQGEESGYTEQVTLTQHIRPNTWNGVGLRKDGYTLIGWNTKEDGNGEHIGLGSRVTVQDGGAITLYAEWRAWMNEDVFGYKKLATNSMAITGYRGAAYVEPFVIPGEISGIPVTEISSSFTSNIPCGSITSKTLILPNTLRKVSDNAFMNSSFSTLYFSDNIETIGDKAFPYNLKTYYLNAFEEPCFLAINNSVSYADAMDRLIVYADCKQMIFFSGCSFTYGVHSDVVDEAYDGEYVVCNMGVNGDINGAFQMECILAYLGEGDVFIHAPEQMSPVQLMSSFYLDGRMFIMTEGNYDLLSIPDFSNVDFLRAFMHYSKLKEKTESCSYVDGCMEYFNEYGDYIEERPYIERTEAERDVTYSNNAYCFDPNLLTNDGVAKLVSYYDELTAKGVQVCLSYAPINKSAREEGEIERRGAEFDTKWREMLAPFGYAPISDVQDYIFLGRYF